MRDLSEAIEIIEGQIASKKARFAIAHEGGSPDESFLMATRDGYLNLTRILLRFISCADRGECREPDEDYAWDGEIKEIMYHLPTFDSVLLTGACLFRDHSEFMTELAQVMDPQLEYPLANDPEYRIPTDFPEL